jgi:hypothetical protein
MQTDEQNPTKLILLKNPRFLKRPGATRKTCQVEIAPGSLKGDFYEAMGHFLMVLQIVRISKEGGGQQNQSCG